MKLNQASRSLRLKLAALICAGGAVASGLAMAPPAAANDQVPDCYFYSVDMPHYSPRAVGIDAKTRYICDPGVTSMTWVQRLYLCVTAPSAPDPNSPGCSVAAVNVGTEAPPQYVTPFTRYVPGAPKSESEPPTGAQGVGWWFQEAGFMTNTNSIVRYLSSPIYYCNTQVPSGCYRW
ncbi:MAG: hypothetical protein QOG34_1847 [Frankiaceae bacterium]|nr:hypothetical protein [Frankiaceae bacterium]